MSIITSLLDTDLYKFTMGNFIYTRYRNIPVVYEFMCRNKGIRLADTIDIDQLDEELRHVMSLRFTIGEIYYLDSLKLLSDDYLWYLDGGDMHDDFHLPEYRLWVDDDRDIHISIEGRWPEVSMWETYILSIISELRCRTFNLDNGIVNLLKKITMLERNPSIKIMEFGTRRRASSTWHRHVLFILHKMVPSNLIGTSNVLLAKNMELTPLGTMAHELDMVVEGVIMSGTDDINALKYTHMRVMDEWEATYGDRLLIDLPDTFGTHNTMEMISGDRLDRWSGMRIDSGDPISIAEVYYNALRYHDIDPTSKTLILSDGLDECSIERYHRELSKYGFNLLYGWGTNLTNDVGIDPISIVVKATRSCGYDVVKLSDNTRKATGNADMIDRLVTIFDDRWTDMKVEY